MVLVMVWGMGLGMVRRFGFIEGGGRVFNGIFVVLWLVVNWMVRFLCTCF